MRPKRARPCSSSHCALRDQIAVCGTRPIRGPGGSPSIAVGPWIAVGPCPLTEAPAVAVASMTFEPIATRGRRCVRSVRASAGDRDADDNAAAALQAGRAVLEAVEAEGERALAEDSRRLAALLGPR